MINRVCNSLLLMTPAVIAMGSYHLVQTAISNPKMAKIITGVQLLITGSFISTLNLRQHCNKEPSALRTSVIINQFIVGLSLTALGVNNLYSGFKEVLTPECDLYVKV